MSYIVHENLKSIDVKYCKVIRTPTKIYVPLFTKKSKTSTDLKEILISTSKLSVPWAKSYSNDEATFNIEFCNHNTNYMDELEGFMDTIVRNCSAFAKNTIHHEQLKVYPNQAKSLRFFNVKTRDVSVYNESGQHIPLESILKDDVVKILFHVYAIYYREKDERKIAIELKLQQIMQMSPNKLVNARTELTDKRGIPPPPPPPLLLRASTKPPIATPTKSSNKPVANPLSRISLTDLITAKSKLKKHA